MSWAEQTRAAVAARLDAEVVLDESASTPTLRVNDAQWVTVIATLREYGFAFFDWLSAVDELAEGFALWCHLASLTGPGAVRRVFVRAQVSRDHPRIASVAEIFPGAAWHERETHEMFGIDFEGPDALEPLLLPDEFEGNPLRKEFVLAARVAKPWPGAKDPGESDGEAAQQRRKVSPPGVPAPESWGPREPGSAPPDPLAAAEPARPAKKATRTPRRGTSSTSAGETPRSEKAEGTQEISGQTEGGRGGDEDGAPGRGSS